ncbi:hypothetical protein Cni_G11914 [Canna indica]|uniref:At4g15545-like C-terminal domain-containing protein n=1 Tax=Canna indica TaxID=4628 RepID=A0AAQ3Q9Z0_9LILI|nr:hypothetical protein Cni_G11914 [Canna indica]
MSSGHTIDDQSLSASKPRSYYIVSCCFFFPSEDSAQLPNSFVFRSNPSQAIKQVSKTEKKQGRGGKMAGAPDFDLPQAVLSVLPTDPFEQLDVARKITSIALANRISALESEVSGLRLRLSEHDDLEAELRAKLETLDASLGNLSDQLDRANDEKETLLNENASLSNTIKKLNRDISRLEIFRKTLMQSLQDEDESPQGVARVAPKVSESASFSSVEDDDASVSTTKSPLQSPISEAGSSVSERFGSGELDGSKENRPVSLLLSLGSTPRLTPPGSPPRRHSISVASTRNIFEERSSIFSSLPSSHHNSMSSPFDAGTPTAGTPTGRTRVDGKDFFRQVRSRLPYEQFSAFLSNVRELNAHKQSREETARKAGEIFGPDNKDLYTIFEGLITRNLH